MLKFKIFITSFFLILFYCVLAQAETLKDNRITFVLPDDWQTSLDTAVSTSPKQNIVFAAKDKSLEVEEGEHAFTIIESKLKLPQTVSDLLKDAQDELITMPLRKELEIEQKKINSQQWGLITAKINPRNSPKKTTIRIYITENQGYSYTITLVTINGNFRKAASDIQKVIESIKFVK